LLKLYPQFAANPQNASLTADPSKGSLNPKKIVTVQVDCKKIIDVVRKKYGF